MKYLVVVLIVLILALSACNTAKDTAKTTEKGGKSATGLAEKMKGGTVGNADEDSGESGDSAGE